MKTAYRLIMLPDAFWGHGSGETGDAVSFVRDALEIEARIPKGVNLENDRKRYWLACQRIQEAARQYLDPLKILVIGNDYLSLLQTITSYSASEGRIGACFFPPDKVQQHIVSFIESTKNTEFAECETVVKRRDFFNMALKKGGGVVEVQVFLPEGGLEGDNESSIPATFPMAGISAVRNDNDNLSPETTKKLLDLFCDTIQSSLQENRPVNFSNIPHSIISEALNKFVYREEPQETEVLLRVVYMDGSEGEPFPLKCLDRPEGLGFMESCSSIRASLISMRHLEMDETVDFAWFRNHKVSVPRPFADTDRYCTMETQRLLDAFHNAPLNMNIYQTGLETAVVGFYRGLVRTMRQQQRSGGNYIRVLPWYYLKRDESYQEGTPWLWKGVTR